MNRQYESSVGNHWFRYSFPSSFPCIRSLRRGLNLDRLFSLCALPCGFPKTFLVPFLFPIPELFATHKVVHLSVDLSLIQKSAISLVCLLMCFRGDFPVLYTFVQCLRFSYLRLWLSLRFEPRDHDKGNPVALPEVFLASSSLLCCPYFFCEFLSALACFLLHFFICSLMHASRAFTLRPFYFPWVPLGFPVGSLNAPFALAAGPLCVFQNMRSLCSRDFLGTTKETPEKRI